MSYGSALRIIQHWNFQGITWDVTLCHWALPYSTLKLSWHCLMCNFMSQSSALKILENRLHNPQWKFPLVNADSCSNTNAIITKYICSKVKKKKKKNMLLKYLTDCHYFFTNTCIYFWNFVKSVGKDVLIMLTENFLELWRSNWKFFNVLINGTYTW